MGILKETVFNEKAPPQYKKYFEHSNTEGVFFLVKDTIQKSLRHLFTEHSNFFWQFESKK